MKWLLTVPADVDLGELRRALAGRGVAIDDRSRIPLDGGEHVIEAEGPAELSSMLEAAGLGTVKASPNSELELYDALEGDE